VARSFGAAIRYFCVAADTIKTSGATCNRIN
jgi:hypothetical protein